MPTAMWKNAQNRRTTVLTSETLGFCQSSVLGCYSACFEHLFVLCLHIKDAFKLYSSPCFGAQGKPSDFAASPPTRSQGWICQCRFEVCSALFRAGAVLLLLLYTLTRGELESGSGNRQQRPFCFSFVSSLQNLLPAQVCALPSWNMGAALVLLSPAAAPWGLAHAGPSQAMPPTALVLQTLSLIKSAVP